MGNLWELEGVTVRATAPEGNLTQGEIVFHKLNGILHYRSGFGVDILLSLQIALGFKIEVVPAQGWATQYPNGSWFGMAQKILDGQADFAIAKTSILPNRAKDLAYLVPTHGLGLYAFFVQPPVNASRNIFIDAFENQLWISILITYLVLIISIRLIILVLKSSKVELSPDDELIVEDDSGFTWVTYVIALQGIPRVPKNPSLRLTFLLGSIVGLITYISYSAILFSMFSIHHESIKSIADLLKSGLQVIIDANNRAANNIMQASDNSTLTKLLKSNLRAQYGSSKDSLLPADKGGIRIFQGKSAFFTFKDTFYTTIKNMFGKEDQDFCNLISTLPVTDVRFRSGLFVAKGSRFKEPFNTKIILMYSTGLMKRFVKLYEESYTPVCDGTNERSASGITFSEIIFAFNFIIFGILISTFASILEKIYSFISNRKIVKTGPSYSLSLYQ